jgi:hypothetical protein
MCLICERKISYSFAFTGGLVMSTIKSDRQQYLELVVNNLLKKIARLFCFSEDNEIK